MRVINRQSISGNRTGHGSETIMGTAEGIWYDQSPAEILPDHSPAVVGPSDTLQ